MTIAFGGGLAAEGDHKLSAINAAVERMAPQTAIPNQRHAIWDTQIGRIYHFLKQSILLCFHNYMCVGHSNEPAHLPILDPIFDLLNDPRNLRSIHAHTKKKERFGT